MTRRAHGGWLHGLFTQGFSTFLQRRRVKRHRAGVVFSLPASSSRRDLVHSSLPAIWVLPLPVLTVVWKLFAGLFVAPVQAFIFALLTLIYLESAVTGGH